MSLSIWKLRTHPFRKPLDDKGNPLPETALFSSLNPREDRRLIRLYFNLYNWDNSKIVNGINEKKVLDRFPDELSLKASKGVLILISGEDAAGRESMQNLILHKINLNHNNKEPLVIPANLDGLSQESNIKLIARSFVRYYKRANFGGPPADELGDLYKSETREKSSGTDSVYSNLFAEFCESIKDYCDRPLVLQLSGGDHYDTWQTVYNSTRHLFKYIIVVTNQEKYAESCAKRLPPTSIAVIKALRLDIATAKLYLQTRLDQERSANLDPKYLLAPFGDEALNALFARGSLPDHKTDVALTIGRLNKILSQALDLHLDQVPYIAAEKNKPIDQLEIYETLVSKNTIVTAMNTV